MKNGFSMLKTRLKPFLPDIAIGVESTYNWYWLADGCREAGIPFYLGHALYMKAVHGGKKKNDRIDSRVITDLMRSNLFPLAYPYPKEMRGTRDLLRRRIHFVVLRAGHYTHIQNTFSQEGVLDIKPADVKRKGTRSNLPEILEHPDIGLSIECDIEMIEGLDPIIDKIEKQVYAQAKHHDPKSFFLLMGIPGIGKILALVILYEIHTIKRFKSARNFSSYCRLVKVERSSNGKNTGEGNNKIGNPYLKWAFTEIILGAQRSSMPIKRYYERLKSKHGPGKAKSIIAHKFAVAVYFMLKNGEGFDEKRFVS
jgi:transposase